MDSDKGDVDAAKNLLNEVNTLRFKAWQRIHETQQVHDWMREHVKDINRIRFWQAGAAFMSGFIAGMLAFWAC